MHARARAAGSGGSLYFGGRGSPRPMPMAMDGGGGRSEDEFMMEHTQVPHAKRSRLGHEWEEEDVLILLEENHQLRREVANLKKRLKHSVDVTDFKHFLEKTLDRVQRLEDPGRSTERCGSRPCSCEVEKDCYVDVSLSGGAARCGTQELRCGSNSCTSLCNRTLLSRKRKSHPCNSNAPAQGIDDHIGVTFKKESFGQNLNPEGDKDIDFQQSEGTRNIFTSLRKDSNSDGPAMPQAAPSKLMRILSAKKTKEPEKRSREVREINQSCMRSIEGSQLSSQLEAVSNDDVHAIPQWSLAQQHDVFVEPSGNPQCNTHKSSQVAPLDNLYVMLQEQTSIQNSHSEDVRSRIGNRIQFPNSQSTNFPPMSVIAPAATSTYQDTVPRLPDVPYIVKVQSLAGSSAGVSTENASDQAVVSSVEELSKEHPEGSSEAIPMTSGSPRDLGNRSMDDFELDTRATEKSAASSSVQPASTSQIGEGSESHGNSRKEGENKTYFVFPSQSKGKTPSTSPNNPPGSSSPICESSGSCLEARKEDGGAIVEAVGYPPNVPSSSSETLQPGTKQKGRRSGEVISHEAGSCGGKDPRMTIVLNKRNQKGVEIYPGSGVFISKAVERHARNSDTFSKMTARLTRAVFTEEEIATCSVTGRMRRGVKKAGLDQNKLRAIIDAVQNIFTTVTPAMVKGVMNNVLYYLRKKPLKQWR